MQTHEKALWSPKAARSDSNVRRLEFKMQAAWRKRVALAFRNEKRQLSLQITRRSLFSAFTLCAWNRASLVKLKSVLHAMSHLLIL